MSGAGLTESSTDKEKNKVCTACIRRQTLTDKSFDFPNIWIEDYLEAEDIALANDTVKMATLNNWTSLEIDGIPIGRYAAYEFLLNYKVYGTQIPEDLFHHYQTQLRNSILSYFAATKIIAAESPSVVLTYNRLYAVNHAFLAAAESQSIPTYSIQGGSHITNRGETVTLFKDSNTQFQILESKAWEESKFSPISTSDTELVSNHMFGLLEASSAFAYSSAFAGCDPKQLRARWQIQPQTKVLLIPMSSEDELNAARLADLLPDTTSRPNIFTDQFEWLEFLFDFAKKRPDLAFILRLHPRMFPNKRENVVAPMVSKVFDLVQNAPNNIKINLPTDDISLYDLAQIIDVVLGYRSTVGAEFAAFGLPVVSPANKDFYTYPETLQRTANTREGYVRQIDEALEEGWSFENVRAAFRWFAFLFTRVAVDFSDSINEKPITIRPKKPGLMLTLWRKLVFILITSGPLIRERIAISNRSTSQLAREVIVDVISNARRDLSESTKWPPRISPLGEENRAISGYLQHLCDGVWANIDNDDSLAGKIRTYLSDNM